MREWSCVVLGMAALLLGATPAAHGQEVVTTREGDISIRLPPGFAPVVVNPVAQLQYADSIQSAFLIVIAEPKDDLFGWNLTRHSTITTAQIVAVTDFPEVRGPTEVTVSGHPGIQHEVRGVVQGTQLVYLQTAVEAPHAFVQIVMWSTRSRWEASEPLFREAIESVQIRSPTAGSPPPAQDLFGIVTGTWIWDGDADCRESPQTFEFSADRTRMTLTIGSPTSSVTEYVVEGVGTNVLHTQIIDESRLTDAGIPVKWDLVVVDPDALTWHRTDWRPDGTTRRLVRCAQGAERARA